MERIQQSRMLPTLSSISILPCVGISSTVIGFAIRVMMRRDGELDCRGGGWGWEIRRPNRQRHEIPGAGRYFQASCRGMVVDETCIKLLYRSTPDKVLRLERTMITFLDERPFLPDDHYCNASDWTVQVHALLQGWYFPVTE
jgi:hypothetical protein